MLHLNTISEAAVQQLTYFSSNNFYSNFALAGGTSLALRFNHRVSVDLDFFSVIQFNPVELDDVLRIELKQVYNYNGNNAHMLFCNVSGVKIDFIYHPFTLIEPFEKIENINFFSVKDVAAMKLFAICRRATKKDFFDIYELLKHFSAEDLISFFSKKYGDDHLIFLAKSILYFEDADLSESPVVLNEANWHLVKEKITIAFNDIQWQK